MSKPANELFDSAVRLDPNVRQQLLALFASHRDAAGFDGGELEDFYACVVDVLHEAGMTAAKKRQKLSTDFARVIGVVAIPDPDTAAGEFG